MRIDAAAALVTGGASGLGAAVVHRLASGGCGVAILDRDRERGEAMAANLPQVRFVAGDVGDEPAVTTALAAAAELGPVRVAVNCAGIGVPPVRTVDRTGQPYPIGRFTRAVEVNLVGTFNVVRLAAAWMARTEPVDADGTRGVIVNTSSIAGSDGQVGQVAYAAAKAAVAGMTLPLARDLAPVGVRVCTVAPGTFDTPILDGPGAPGDVATFVDALVADNAFPARPGRPEEFASLVLQVIGNDMFNGATIRLDAGARLRARPGT